MPRRSTFKPSYPRLSTLKGLLTKYNLCQAKFAKLIGRATSTVSKSLNGYSLFDSNDMKNIRDVINRKEAVYAKSAGREAHIYTVDEIFFL